MNSTNKEIDIFELYRRVVSFVRRRWLMITLIAVVGGGLGLTKEKMSGVTYEGLVVVSSEVVNDELLYKKLYPVINDNNRVSSAQLADFLNADPEIFSGYKSCSVDTTVFSEDVVLKFHFSDTIPMNELIESFDTYFNSQEDICSRFEMEIEKNKSFLTYIQAEIDDINTLQESILENSNRADLVVMSMTGSSNELLDIYKLKEQYESRLLIEKAVDVRSANVVLVKEPSLIKSFVIWFILFSLLGFIAALVLELERESKKRNS